MMIFFPELKCLSFNELIFVGRNVFVKAVTF